MEGSRPHAPHRVGDVSHVSGPTKAQRWRLWGRLALAPIACGLAVWTHFSLNVPAKIPDGPTKKKPGAAVPAKKTTARAPKPARTSKPRTDAEMAELRAKWAAKPVSEEPVDRGFARRGQAVIRRAFVVSRSEAFEGSPERPNVVLTTVECATVRCTFRLRGQFDAELTDVLDVMRGVAVGDEPLWRRFDPGPIEPSTGEDRVVSVEVDFTHDGNDASALRTARAEPGPAEDDGE